MKSRLICLLSAVTLLCACRSHGESNEVSAPLCFSDGSSGWVKYEGNPVLGNAELGTCFDVNVIDEGPASYNMYFSWRPKNSIAVSRSEDGMKPETDGCFGIMAGWAAMSLSEW